MASSDLHDSWARTEGFLREARSHLSEVAEADHAATIAEFDDYIEHNELGLALDALRSIVKGSDFESPRVLESLALAAASMGMLEEQRELDNELTQLRGWKYETKLPGGSDAT